MSQDVHEGLLTGVNGIFCCAMMSGRVVTNAFLMFFILHPQSVKLLRLFYRMIL